MVSYLWPQHAQLALSLVVNVGEGAEGNMACGDRGPEAVDALGTALRQPLRNYGNENNYQYGIKGRAGRILRLLDTYQMPATFIATFEVLYGAGATQWRMMSLGVHLWIIRRPGYIRALERFLQHIRTKTCAWCATRTQIADPFAAHVPALTRAPV